MRIAILSALVLSCMASMPSAAIAQPSQTAEGAKEFVSIVLPRTKLQVTSAVDGSDVPGYYSSIPQVRFNSPCTILIDIVSEGFTTSTGETYPKISEQGIWNLAKFTEFRQDGSKIYLFHPGIINRRGWTTLEVISAELAARLTYAFEFLRVDCDPTAKTGF